MFCFDNTFSTVSEKIIFFELILDNMEAEGEDPEDWKEYVHGTDMLDMKLEDIMVSSLTHQDLRPILQTPTKSVVVFALKMKI